MIYNNFGNSGLKISAISLGTANLANIEQIQAYQTVIEESFKRGVNYFDTAEIYGGGMSQKILGTILKNLKIERQQVIIGTKILTAVSPDRNSTLTTNRKHIREGIIKSLERLQLDYVDIIYAHLHDETTPMQEICRSFHELIEDGLAFYWATSNWEAQAVFEALSVCERLNLHKPIGGQNNYNMLKRQTIEVQYESLFRKYNYGLIAWSPLAGGILTGKYLKEIGEGVVTRFNDTSPNYPLERIKKMFYSPFATEKCCDSLRQIQKIAEDMNCKPVHLALAWLMKYKPLCSALIGARNIEQLNECLEAIQLTKKWNTELQHKISQALSNIEKRQTFCGQNNNHQRALRK